MQHYDLYQSLILQTTVEYRSAKNPQHKTFGMFDPFIIYSTCFFLYFNVDFKNTSNNTIQQFVKKSYENEDIDLRE